MKYRHIFECSPNCFTAALGVLYEPPKVEILGDLPKIWSKYSFQMTTSIQQDRL